MKKSESVKIEKKNDADVYEMKKIIIKRKIYIKRKRRRRTHFEFRMKWTEWKNHHNKWMKREDLNNCQKLFQKFEIRNQT